MLSHASHDEIRNTCLLNLLKIISESDFVTLLCFDWRIRWTLDLGVGLILLIHLKIGFILCLYVTLLGFLGRISTQPDFSFL